MYHSKEHFEQSKKEKRISGGLMIAIGVILAIISVLKFIPQKDLIWGILAAVSLAVVSFGGVLIAGKL